jgi:hypothetical protein
MKPFAVTTLEEGRWQTHRFARYTSALRFRIAESRRLRLGLSVHRLTRVDGGLLDEHEGHMPGTWVRT